jgi:hypothetical protein
MQMFQEKGEHIKTGIGNGPPMKMNNINALTHTGGTWHFPAVVNIPESSYLVLQDEFLNYKIFFAPNFVDKQTLESVSRGNTTLHLERVRNSKWGTYTLT